MVDPQTYLKLSTVNQYNDVIIPGNLFILPEQIVGLQSNVESTNLYLANGMTVRVKEKQSEIVAKLGNWFPKTI